MFHFIIPLSSTFFLLHLTQEIVISRHYYFCAQDAFQMILRDRSTYSSLMEYNFS